MKEMIVIGVYGKYTISSFQEPRKCSTVLLYQNEQSNVLTQIDSVDRFLWQEH